MRDKQTRLRELSEWAMREKDQGMLRALVNEILQLLVEIREESGQSK
jgi:hypothetical protein